MTRQEFIQELELALQGQLSQAAVNDNIRYYDNYIKEEVRKGNTEQAVEDGWNVKMGGRKLNSWLGKFFLIVAAILIVVVAANVVAFLLPILVPVVLILLICSLFFGNRR